MATQGLFQLLGDTPQDIRSKYEAGLMLSPQEMGQQGLLQQVISTIAQGGTGFGYGLSRALGGKAPGETEAEARQQALTQAQAEGATGSALYQALARQLSAAGDTRGAFMAAEKAREMAQQEEAAQVGLALKKAQLAEAQAKAKADPRAARAQELLKTGKYTPESVAKFQETGKADDLQYKGAEKTKIEKLLDAQGITVENGKGEQRKQILASAIEKETKGDPAQLAQLKLLQAQTELQLAQAKLREKELKIEQGKKADVLKNILSVGDTNDTITFIKKSRSILNTKPAVSGLAGQLQRDVLRIEELPANILNTYYETLKAKIGFNELNKMREASPTGGALGQVTERELSFLQAVRGKLSVGLPKEVQLAALEQIETSLRVLSYIKNKIDKGEKIPDDFIKKFYPDGVPTEQQLLARIGEAPSPAPATASGAVQTPAAPAVAGRKSLSSFDR